MANLSRVLYVLLIILVVIIIIAYNQHYELKWVHWATMRSRSIDFANYWQSYQNVAKILDLDAITKLEVNEYELLIKYQFINALNSGNLERIAELIAAKEKYMANVKISGNFAELMARAFPSSSGSIEVFVEKYGVDSRMLILPRNPFIYLLPLVEVPFRPRSGKKSDRPPDIFDIFVNDKVLHLVLLDGTPLAFEIKDKIIKFAKKSTDACTVVVQGQNGEKCYKLSWDNAYVLSDGKDSIPNVG